ncbi:hypothetical protein DIS24_g6643 [Lasiodiplodia hormozganensis]|uniref:Orc1-like AAA ATPase domain-containing protein n=1 Tax=Lasiodiplodia hormozganensis TaxID=869390 RepID=A0AA40CVE2_9PEZI|nr:hypothetical protein DIS24_g6643 [Lasiodiplodia hormozganensis]
MPTPSPSPASASGAAPSDPAPFTTSTQYAATLAGTKKYLQDVNALIVLLTPPVSPASGATIARFVRLATSSNRFYVLALGHFPTLRKTLIQAVIGGANAGGGPSTDDDDSAAALTLPYPTKMQEHLLCCFQTYRLEAGVPHTPTREEGQEGREVVRDALLVALEVVRRYMGKERDGQGGAGTGPGSWGEVCEAADVMAAHESIHLSDTTTKRVTLDLNTGYLRSPRHIPRYRLYPGHPLYRPDFDEAHHDGKSKGSSSGDEGDWKSKLLETTITTLGSVVILGGVGFAYQRYYKSQVLSKIENAFNAGFSSLELAALVRHSDGKSPINVTGELPEAAWWIQRDEQRILDDILAGRAQGHYYLLTGEKGTGKTSMLLEGMRKANGEGVALLEAHGDPEIFRVRLGKALDFEFHEDYIGSLFSFKGPRDTTALLDIERAFNKLEKVALRRHEQQKRPLVLVINGIHLLRDDDDGKDLLELIQQRAELWSASGLITLVLSSDDYWISERLIQQATRMQVLNIPDVPRDVAVDALKRFRFKFKDEEIPNSVLHEVYSMVGGRLRFLNQVARAENMLEMCEAINRKEKIWLLNQCWILGEEMDDDVMDQQKFCAAAMVLASALVDLEESDSDPTRLPQVEVHKAREIMTRADFLQQMDHINIVAIDSNAMVRADSVPMQNAFREICKEPGFKEHLEATVDRISAIESLGRTRELVLKDLVGDGEYQLAVKNPKGYDLETITMKVKPAPEES